MLSQRKVVLLIAACAAVLGSVLTVGLAGAVHLVVVSPEGVRQFFGPVIGLLCFSFIPAVVLQIEYAQALRGAEFRLLTEESLSLGQFLESLCRCPRPITFLCLGLALVAFVFGWFNGMPSWSSNEPLTAPVASAIMLFQAPFVLLALPIVVSGLRVPGSFAAQLGARSPSVNGT